MKSDNAWKQWGQKDPYYGVLSHSRFRKDNLAGHLRDFTQSGKVHWEMVHAICTKLYGETIKGRAADFGCGVGRVLAPMAHDYEQTVGIDISPHMLEEAKKNSPGSELILSDDNLSMLTGTLDFVHSFIVLQHIPPRRGIHFIHILLDHLSSGGVAVLHLTLKRPAASGKRIVYFLKHRVLGARLLFNILQGKALWEPVMQMNEYDLEKVVAELGTCGMKDIFITPQPTSDTFGVIIFARKRPA